MAGVSEWIKERRFLRTDSKGKDEIRLSIATKLILSFLLIIGMTSVIFSGVAILMTNDHMKADAQEQVREDFDNTRDIYLNKLNQINDVIVSTADNPQIRDAVSSGRTESVANDLVGKKNLEALDILTITDASGKVLIRAGNTDAFGDYKNKDELVQAVLRNKMPIATTAIITAEDLSKESPIFSEGAFNTLTDAPEQDGTENINSMMLGAAAPIFGIEEELIGVVVGGILLNNNQDLICEIKRSVFNQPNYFGNEIGFVTIYQDDQGILTCPRDSYSTGPMGSTVSSDVYEKVVLEGRSWEGRDYVMDNWYTTAYEPIKNAEYDVIGILQVGQLELKYIDIKNQYLVAFISITLIGAFVAILFSYFISKRISTPLNKLVTASRKVAKGDLAARVDTQYSSNDELGELAESFNAMASALEERDEKLKEFTRTRVGRSERLALIGKLSADVAHELNNPLQGIVAYSHLLLERMPDGHPDIDSVQKIVTQANRSRDIIRGLLDFSRQRKPEKRPCDVNDVLQDCLSLLENQAFFHNIQVIKELDPGLPSAVLDPSQIERVFMNVIINAAEAMEGQGTLTLVTQIDLFKEYIEVTISDTGYGIAEEDLKRIFDPFFTTKEVGQGTGLGLAISYGIVKEHRGTISAESEIGKGTIFTIRLPVSTEEMRANNGRLLQDTRH